MEAPDFSASSSCQPLLDALEHGADALRGESRDHGGEQREARSGLHQPGDPFGVELDDVGPQFPDAVHVGILRTVVVDGDAEAVGPERRDEAEQRFLGGGFLLGDLADDAARVDAGLMQHQPHVAQRAVGDRPVGEDGRIEVDEERGLRRQAGRRVEQMEGARQRFDMQPVGGRNAVEEGAGRPGLAVAKGPDQPFEGGDRQLAALEGKDRLERAFQRVRAPHAGRRAVGSHE